MTENECKSIFTLAGIPVLRVWELPNGYWPSPKQRDDDREYETRQYLRYHKLRDESPWWLVKTPFGLIEIGWRKRVIHIDWTDTPLRMVVTEDPVTKGETYVHAWSVEDAVKYLRVVRGGAPAEVVTL